MPNTLSSKFPALKTLFRHVKSTKKAEPRWIYDFQRGSAACFWSTLGAINLGRYDTLKNVSIFPLGASRRLTLQECFNFSTFQYFNFSARPWSLIRACES